jgi:hypothetical protein
MVDTKSIYGLIFWQKVTMLAQWTAIRKKGNG